MQTDDGPKSAARREQSRTSPSGTMTVAPTSTTTGWQPGCECFVWQDREDARPGHGPHKVLVKGKYAEPVPCAVLDPFFGSGTVGVVAAKLGRNSIGIELNPEYAAMAAKRLRENVGLLCNVLNEPQAPAPTGH